MKNREYKKLLTIAIATALVLGSVGTARISAMATNTKQVATTAETKKETKQPKAAINAETNPFKSETVYIKTNQDGATHSVIVSDQLRNINHAGPLGDASILENIENVKGDETFSKTDHSLTWNANEKDICYQGTTTKALPVGIHVTYTLDGKQMTAEQLKGKSGHLVVRYQYENLSAKQDGFVPFLMVTGLIYDSDKITNATVTNGRLISDGDREIVVGMGLPALKEELALSEDTLALPDYFEFEADVRDYELSEGMTIATNELFNELDTKQFDSLSELTDSMHKLQDASNKLVSGSGELKKGLDTLLASSGSLTDGVQKLTEGSAALSNGTASLSSGSKELADGSKTLADGTSQLADGTRTLQGGALKVSAGLSQASKNTSELLLPGAKALDDGVARMQNEMQGGLMELSKAVLMMDAGLNNPLTEQQPGLKDSITAVNQVLTAGTEATNNQGLTTITKNTAAAAEAFAKAMQTSDPEGEKVMQDSMTALAALAAREDLPADVRASIAQNVKTLQEQLTKKQQAVQAAEGTLRQVVIGAKTSEAVVANLSENMMAIQAGTAKLADGAKLLNQKLNAKDGLLAQVNSGISELKSGTAKLRAGIDGKDGLANGLNQLAAGASKVNDGATTLQEKMGEAATGAIALSKGAIQLQSGSVKLHAGADTLVNGLSSLNSGSKALIGGVKKLDDGATALNNGMIQFNEDGIQKLVEIFDGDIDKLLDQSNQILNKSKQYKNFSGIADGMDGDVKFIFIAE